MAEAELDGLAAEGADGVVVGVGPGGAIAAAEAEVLGGGSGGEVLNGVGGSGDAGLPAGEVGGSKRACAGEGGDFAGVEGLILSGPESLDGLGKGEGPGGRASGDGGVRLHGTAPCAGLGGGQVGGGGDGDFDAGEAGVDDGEVNVLGDDAEPDQIGVVGGDADAREGEEVLGGVGGGAQGEDEGAEEQQPAVDREEKGWGAGDGAGQKFLVLTYGNLI